MKKVLVAFFSKTGTTETMAEYIAEGVRIAGHEVALKKVSDIKSEKDLEAMTAIFSAVPPILWICPSPSRGFYRSRRGPA